MFKLNYISNIDTIYILLDIKDYESSSKKILEFLEQEKQMAKLAATSSADYKHLITIMNTTFQLCPISTQGYSYILRNNSYEVKISRYRSKLENFYPIQVRISSETLWSNGVLEAWSSFCELIENTFGKIINNKVCRLDLCTHVSNVDLVNNFENSYKGKFKKKNTTYTGNSINSITFGSRKSGIIYCRIYNKSLEIQEMHHKLWFKEIWQANNMDIQSVWNIEFEIKSNLLRKFMIFTFEDVMYYIRDLWEYCTCEWLIKVKPINTRIERCPISPEWLEIQKAYNLFNAQGLIAPTIISNIDAETLVPNISGLITSFCARKKENNIDNALHMLKKSMLHYFSTKNKTFEENVREKMVLLLDSEVKHLE